MRALAPLAATLTLVACAPPATPSPGNAPPTGSAWRQARSELAALRARVTPPGPHKATVKLAMHHAPSDRHLEARGAVAVDGEGLRMILLGPGGTTAMDLWICGDDYRYVVPVAELEERGTIAEAPSGGFPVAFLRWWFLHRLEGRLLTMADGDFVLTDGGTVFRVSDGDPLVVARGGERMTLTGGRCGQATYERPEVGLRIDVTCEALDEQRPPAAAFADPDAPDRPCPGSGT